MHDGAVIPKIRLLPHDNSRGKRYVIRTEAAADVATVGLLSVEDRFECLKSGKSAPLPKTKCKERSNHEDVVRRMLIFSMSYDVRV